MYIFAHAMAGIIIGLMLVPLTGDRRTVALATFGAILPDLIDKPLGHIILAGTLNYGRLYFHGLTILSLFVVTGLLLYHYRHQIGLLVLSAGIASHHVLDGMWHNPVVWFWPFLGPIPGRDYSDDYFWESILRQLTQPSEWIFLFLIVGLFAYLYRRELKIIIGRLTDLSIRRAVVVIATSLIIVALLISWSILI